jgi:hypothetical protein
MVTPTEHKVHPSSAVESDTGANRWTKLTPGTRSRDKVVKKPGSSFVYVIMALAVLIGAYFLYASERKSIRQSLCQHLMFQLHPRMSPHQLLLRQRRRRLQPQHLQRRPLPHNAIPPN